MIAISTKSLAIMAALSLASCSLGGESSENILQDAILDLGNQYALLDVTEVNRQASISRNRITPAAYEELKCLASAGFLVFTNDTNIADGNFRGFDTAFATSQQGTLRYITIELTPKGQELDRQFDPPVLVETDKAFLRNNRVFKLRLFTDTVQRVVDDRLIENASGSFRVMNALISRQWTDAGREIQNACGREMHTNLRFRVLLKRNSFADRWERLAGDITASDVFVTQTVDTELEKLDQSP